MIACDGFHIFLTAEKQLISFSRCLMRCHIGRERHKIDMIAIKTSAPASV
jgi:hypothetical protein